MAFVCHLGSYRYAQLSFNAAVAGYMFQQNIDEIFKDLSNIFSTADDILIVGMIKLAITTIQW